MICKNCGAQIGDNYQFCGKCGAPTGLISQPIEPNGTAAVLQKSGSRAVKLVLIIAAVVIIALASTIAIVINSRPQISPEELAEKLSIAVAEVDYDTICDCIAFDYDGAVNLMVKYNSFLKNHLEETYGTSNVRQIWNRPEEREKVKERYMSLYGDDYKISCEIISSSVLTESEQAEAVENYKEMFFDITKNTDFLNELSLLYKQSNLDNTEEMRLIEMNTAIKGSLGEHTDDFSVYCVKINGVWKAITFNFPSFT